MPGSGSVYFFAGADVRFWPKADMSFCAAHVRFQGVKQTWRFAEVSFRGRYAGVRG
jgi:hypothetical protein